MRLLLLSPEFPIPPTNATRHRIYHLLQFLGGTHEISLLTFREPTIGVKAQSLAQVADLGCRETVVFPWRRDTALRDALASMLDPAPHAYRKFRVGAFRDQLRRLADRQAYDVVHFDLNLAEMRDCLTGREATVIAPCDSFAKMMLRMAWSSRNVARKAYALEQAVKFWRAERVLYPRFTKCHVVSRAEAEFLRRINRNIDTAVVPIGAEVPDNCASEAERHPKPAIVLSGQMNSPFTVDGAVWFRREVWPIIKAEAPETCFFLIGRCPDRRLEGLSRGDAAIVVTGYVEDMAAALRDKMVYICPLLYGAGVKTRLLEAMAHGLPIVTTSIGAEGIAVIHGRHVLIADSAEEFASGVLSLLRSADLRQSLAMAAHALVKAQYTWRAYAEGMESLYREACEKRRRLGDTVVSR